VHEAVAQAAGNVNDAFVYGAGMVHNGSHVPLNVASTAPAEAHVRGPALNPLLP
jgi:hypothetical protein